MLRYVGHRIALAVPLALGVATLVFLLLETAPGDPVDLMLGDRPVPSEVRQRIEHTYGFDRSPAQRYVGWLSAVFVDGDLGWSHSRSRPVGALLAEALPATLALAVTAMVLHLAAGIGLGIVSVARQGAWTDRLLTAASLLLYAMPTFWLGLMAVLGFSYFVPVFPASSMQSVGAEHWGFWARLADRAWHLALPASVLGIGSAAAMSRFVRAGLIENLGRGFVRAARARGLAETRVVCVHALKNALLPVISLAGISMPVLLSGALVTEVVFAWPGMGRLTYDAIRAHDVPVVLATTWIATLLVIAGNLAADLAMATVDPRIRLSRGGETG